MPVIKFFRKTALPATPQPNSIYFITPPNKPNYVEIYVVGNTSSAIRRVLNEDDINALIQAQLQSVSEIQIVNNITERNALNPTGTIFVLVLDASDDPTVDSGSASYIYNPSTSSWVKIAEYESLDLQLTWNNITGRPSSSPADIDDAVAKRHTHSNLTQLNKISEDANGFLTYNNDYPKTGWDSTSW